MFSAVTILAIVKQGKGLNQKSSEEVPEKQEIEEVKLVFERNRSLHADLVEDKTDLVPVLPQIIRLLYETVSTYDVLLHHSGVDSISGGG